MNKQIVLLIDECNFPRLLIKNMLSELHVKVIEANSLSEGLKQFLEYKPSVVIFGSTMNDDKSLYLSRAFRKRDSSVKIIFTLKKAFTRTVADFFISGSNRLFILPLNKEQLQEEIMSGPVKPTITRKKESIENWS